MSSNILVLGGAGGLGRAVVRRFAAAQWNTINVDFKYNPSHLTHLPIPKRCIIGSFPLRMNEESKNSVLLSPSSSWQVNAWAG